ADFANDLGQLTTRNGDLEDVPAELANGGEGSMAGPLEEGNPGGQLGPNQATALHGPGHGGIVQLLAVGAPTGVRAVFADLHGHNGNVQLLDDPRGLADVLQGVATVRAAVQTYGPRQKICNIPLPLRYCCSRTGE